MVARTGGQTTSEFVVMMAVLTALGLVIMNVFVGSDGKGGVIRSSGGTEQKAIVKIASDQ